jgi:integrase
MPRRPSGPRLWLEERKGRPAYWCILDRGKITRTGCPHEDREGAERALSDYIVAKHEPSVAGRQTSVADILLIYAGHNAADPVPYHCRALAPFWHDKTLADVTAANCRAYVASRPVKPATARRELETLNAAIRFCAREKGTPVILVTYPPKSPPKERFLTREEAAALLWAAWRSGNRHLARFILIGLYTGTRHDAILRLQWRPNTTGGWVDLEQGIMHRRASGAKRTRKRQPPVRLNRKLLAHLRRWRRLDEGVSHVVSWADRPIKKERRAWARAREMAGLGPDVTPHALRHTTVTWLLLAGLSTWDVANFVGMSEKTVREVYGHHSPHYQAAAAAAF